MADILAVGQYLAEAFRAEYISQGGLGEKAGRLVSIHHIHDRHDRIKHAVIDHRVDGNRHRVLRQNLESESDFSYSVML